MTAEDVRPTLSLNSRVVAALVFVALTLVLVGYVPGSFGIDVLIGLFRDGALLAFFLAGAAGYGAWPTRWLAGRPNEQEAGGALLRGVTAVGLGMGLVSLLTLGLGLAGVLNRGTASVLLGVGGALLVLALRKTKTAGARQWLEGRPDWLWLVLVPAAALVILAASVLPGLLWKPFDPHPYDVLSYHLQIPREWYEIGRIVPLKHNAFSFFPLVVETQDLLLMHLAGGPWKGMYAAQLLSGVYLGLTTLATCAVTRRAGGGRTGGFVAAVIAATVPWSLMLGSVAYVEAALMLFTTLAVGWVLPVRGWTRRPRTPGFDVVVASRPHATNEGPGRDAATTESASIDSAPVPARAVALAGLLAGCAAGTKYTAVPMVAGVLGCSVLLGQFRAPVRAIKHALVLALLSAAVFAPWALRNLAWTGNPVFPLATSFFGKAHFTDDQVERYRLAHSPPPALRPLAPRARAALSATFGDPQSCFELLGRAASIWYVIVPASFYLLWRRGRTGLMIVVFLAGNVLIWFFATHVISRFVAHLFPLGAVAVGLAAGDVLSRLSDGQFRWINPPLRATAIVLALLQTFVVARVFDTYLPHTSTEEWLWRLEDVSRIESANVDALRPLNLPLALVGDAQPFLHSTPAPRTTYRTVFDVNIPPGKDAADGWLGEDVATLRKGRIVIVSGNELQRLSETYYRIVPPDPKWLIRREPTVLGPE